MEYYSIDDFRNLVDRVKEQAWKAEHEARVAAYDLLPKYGDGMIRELIDGEELRDACRDYLDALSRDVWEFVVVCDDVLALQAECARRVDLAFGLVDPVHNEESLVYQSTTVEELTARIHEVAGTFANEVQLAQQKFHEAWKILETAFEDELALFKASLVRRYDVPLEVLDRAVIEARDATVTGLILSALVVAGTAEVVVAFFSSAVQAVLEAAKDAWDAAASAHSVWAYFDTPEPRR
ncbi:hypothetical protein ACFQ78_32080 [Streptomyces sp. NPDC056519]|uniref:hypothetical protein n=1 Tax=Streptomyces sp. NPDC056519 TaxID=3345849 RepID=UPI0036C6A9B8